MKASAPCTKRTAAISIRSTGVIQWMLNNAWPSMIWHLYDYYLRPGGGYFGAKRAMEALHPIYGYDDHSIWVVSSQYEDVKGTEAHNEDLQPRHDGKVLAGKLAGCRPPTARQKSFTLPDVSGLSATYFVALQLARLGWQSCRIELLLAVDQAGNSRLGKDQLVDDAHRVVCGLHRDLAIAEGETESH